METVKNKIYEKPGVNLVFHLCRIILGAVLFYASLSKIGNPEEFAEIIYNYQLLPDELLSLAAIVLPWMELVTGVLLIFKTWMPGAVLLANGLFFTFLVAILSVLVRGLNIDCGCFSTSGETGGLNMITFLRDFFFLLMSLFLLISVWIGALKTNNLTQVNK